MLTDTDAIKKDIDRLTLAEEAAKKIQAFRENERTKLTSDLAGLVKEAAAIEKHLAEVNKLLARARQLTADLMRPKRSDGRRTGCPPIASSQAGRGRRRFCQVRRATRARQREVSAFCCDTVIARYRMDHWSAARLCRGKFDEQVRAAVSPRTTPGRAGLLLV